MARELYTGGGYLVNNPSWHVEDSPWKAQHILHMLEKHRLRPASICEVGCGAGEILVRLEQALRAQPGGVRCTGYEIAPDAYALAKSRERPGLRFVLGDVSSEPDGAYELMLLIDVIEHLEDYFAFLRALKPKSRYKLLHVPLDLSVQSVLRRGRLLKSRDGAGHLHYFTRETALRALQDSGYQVLDCFYTHGAGELEVSSLLARAARLPRRALSRFSEDLSARLLGGYSVMVLVE